MASNSDQSSFISDSPDSGVDFETLSQQKFISNYRNDWIRYEADNNINKLTRDREQEQAIFEEEFDQLGFCKFENPLSEPIVRLSLKKVKITGIQLMNMSVKELNKRLAHCPPFIVGKLKKCRRTLKNRGYAKNCRIKRIAMKNRLEEVNKNLLLENRDLRKQNKSLTDQLNHMLAGYHSNQQHQNITDINNNQHQHHNQQQQEVVENNNFNQSFNLKTFNQSNGQQQLINSAYSGMTTPVANDYTNQTYPLATMTTSITTNNVDSYYPLESELDYLAEQLALEQ